MAIRPIHFSPVYPPTSMPSTQALTVSFSISLTRQLFRALPLDFSFTFTTTHLMSSVSHMPLSACYVYVYFHIFQICLQSDSLSFEQINLSNYLLGISKLTHFKMPWMELLDFFIFKPAFCTTFPFFINKNSISRWKH